ncbi:hypothetical protein H4R33_004783 [Dimargaris cristalligena]|nr:hypothetical protein H4R33_004783 [Dimargaris cristalligena]
MRVGIVFTLALATSAYGSTTLASKQQFDMNSRAIGPEAVGGVYHSSPASSQWPSDNEYEDDYASDNEMPTEFSSKNSNFATTLNAQNADYLKAAAPGSPFEDNNSLSQPNAKDIPNPRITPPNRLAIPPLNSLPPLNPTTHLSPPLDKSYALEYQPTWSTTNPSLNSRNLAQDMPLNAKVCLDIMEYIPIWRDSGDFSGKPSSKVSVKTMYHEVQAEFKHAQSHLASAGFRKKAEDRLQGLLKAFAVGEMDHNLVEPEGRLDVSNHVYLKYVYDDENSTGEMALITEKDTRKANGKLYNAWVDSVIAFENNDVGDNMYTIMQTCNPQLPNWPF